jgi:hypothetical protein
MTTVFIVQGEHYSVPGRPLSVHRTRELAYARALDLVNIILADLGRKLATDWREGLARIKKSPAGDESDVWVEEHYPDGIIGSTVDDSEPGDALPVPKPYKLTAMNMKRRRWTEQALATFATATGQTLKHDEPEIVGDFLADLMHYCAQRGIDFEDRLRNGRMHFSEESQGREG